MHKYNPNIHHRQSIRLKEYDYSSPGAYFMTICTYQKEYLFGEIIDGKMKLNQFGKTLKFTWFDLPNHISGIILGEYVIMPNHFHGIIEISPNEPVGVGFKKHVNQGSLSKPTPTAGNQTILSKTVHNLKSKTTRKINLQRNTPGHPVWQRNYYERIIRDEISLDKIREYIIHNPINWRDDDLFI
jgi:REP element-mobilizing transposase RayT